MIILVYLHLVVVYSFEGSVLLVAFVLSIIAIKRPILLPIEVILFISSILKLSVVITRVSIAGKQLQYKLRIPAGDNTS